MHKNQLNTSLCICFMHNTGYVCYNYYEYESAIVHVVLTRGN